MVHVYHATSRKAAIRKHRRHAAAAHKHRSRKVGVAPVRNHPRAGLPWRLPLAVAAFVALRIAERVLGREKVRAWVRARTEKSDWRLRNVRSGGSSRWCRACARSLLVRALRDLAQHRQFAVAATLVAVAVRLGTAGADNT